MKSETIVMSDFDEISVVTVQAYLEHVLTDVLVNSLLVIHLVVF